MGPVKRERVRSGVTQGRAQSAAAIATERPNPATAEIDALDTIGVLRALQAQDAGVPAAVKAAIPKIARAVEAVIRSLRRGGRLLYVGAGTSGRIGVMDAAECPPTFGVSAAMIQGVIAGGSRALGRAVEFVEDDAEQGGRDLAARRVGPRDVVIALAASGRTPYTLGALRYARTRRATTIALTCSRGSPITRLARIAIVTQTGPEAIAGSTRLKAALAQMMALHMISTAAMIRLGHVYRNYMVGVRPTNRKLIERACSIIGSVAGVSRERAAEALKQARSDVKVAIVMLRRGLNRRAALQLLRRHQGNLRAIE